MVASSVGYIIMIDEQSALKNGGKDMVRRYSRACYTQALVGVLCCCKSKLWCAPLDSVEDNPPL